MSDATNPVLLEVENGVAHIILNRPERKNAITGPLGRALAETLSEASRREDAQVIVLRGSKDAFCSGLDLDAFNADPEPDWMGDFQNIWRQAHNALYESPKPIVGALQRYAINGGAALAIACDLLVTGEKAFLQVGEVQIGMAAPYNLAWLSLRHSEATLASIALVGDRLDGAALQRLGLAQMCVADDQVLAEATALAERLAAFPGNGLARIKAGLRARMQIRADDWFDRFVKADPVQGRTRPQSMRTR